MKELCAVNVHFKKEKGKNQISKFSSRSETLALTLSWVLLGLSNKSIPAYYDCKAHLWHLMGRSKVCPLHKLPVSTNNGIILLPLLVAHAEKWSEDNGC